MKRRNNNIELLKATEAFEPADQSLLGGTCGNIQSVFDPQINYSKMIKTREGLFGKKYFYEMVSAPMLLAKLVASYHGLDVGAQGQKAYKVTWTVVLKHKKSGHILTFYDWKGGASFGSNLGDELPAQFKKDVAELLKALADERFPHPYDGCSIGEIA